MIKKTDSKEKTWLSFFKKIKVEDLLLLVVGILIVDIVVVVLHYSLPGNSFPTQAFLLLAPKYYFYTFIKSTSIKYIFFVLMPLLVVWIAKLFQKKTWNFKKTILWTSTGIVIMLLIYFGAPSVTGFENIPKAENPNVKMFVMSFCPFGQKAETAMKPVQELFGDKVTIEPYFIITAQSGEGLKTECLMNNTLCSLHGINELNEDIRQMCIWKYNQDEWWNYVQCINDNCDQYDVETCWQSCAEQSQISVAKIRACQKLEGISLAEKDRDLSEDLGVTGSPTIIINNAIYQGDKTSEMLKKAICTGFENPPAECETKLQESKKVTENNLKENNAKKDIGILEKKGNEGDDKCLIEGVCPVTGKKIQQEGETNEKEE